MDALGGSISANLVGTYMLTKELDPIPTNPNAKVSCVGIVSSNCFPTPEIRATVGVRYDSNSWWTVGGRLRYFDKVKYDGTVDRLAASELGTQTYVDLNATFRFMENSDIAIGINNVMDDEPPLLGGTLVSNANTIAGFYDTLGRYVFANLTLRF